MCGAESIVCASGYFARESCKRPPCDTAVLHGGRTERVSEGDYWRRPGEAFETQTLFAVVAKESGAWLARRRTTNCVQNWQPEGVVGMARMRSSVDCECKDEVMARIQSLLSALPYPCSSRCRTISVVPVCAFHRLFFVSSQQQSHDSPACPVLSARAQTITITTIIPPTSPP